MPNNLTRIFCFLTGCALFTACITSKPYYDKSSLNWEKANSPDSLRLKYTIFLIGDVGNPESSRQEPVLKLLQSQLYYRDTLIAAGSTDTTFVNTSDPKDMVIFLGDNIYDNGLPEPDASDREEKERRIKEQMNVVKNFRGKTIFVPGNHDWNHSNVGGLEAIKRQEAFIENYLDSADVFLPSNGCGGPVELQFNNDLVVIVLDTEWWLQKYDKSTDPSDGCTAATRLEVIQQVQDIITRNKGKNIVFAQHHPLFSNGKHGGYYTLIDYIFPLTLVKDNLYIPLPVIGSIYPLMRQYGVSRQDLSNKDYQQLKRGLLAVLQEEKNVVIAAGHEHALQLNKYNDINHIISGAGSKNNPLVKGNDALFANGTKGFARLNYYDNGQCWAEFWVPEGDGSTGKLVFRTPLYAIPPKNQQELTEEVQISYKDSTKVLAAGEQYKASQAKQNLFGEHYRETWATPVKVKYLDPSTYAGGLTPIKMGGGKQTTSLQLEGKDGNVYQFRTINKDPSALLPESFQKTFAEDLVQDQISSAHPYGALIVPDMAKAIGIYHTNPELVYMPYSRLLGPYIQQVGGKLGIIEARPDEDVSDFKSFGNAKNAVGTPKVYEKLLEDNDNEIDQQMFVKARLFDMLIGDWDRHEDQWRWAEFKKDKGSLYRPIPRDRDQAFVKYDGIIPSMVSKVVHDLQNFDYSFGNMAYLSIAARNLDRNFLNKLSETDWVNAARGMQKSLTDEVIRSSVRKMPPEVYAESGEEIEEKLISRRNQLVDAAMRYYKVLAEEVTVVGSDKHEFFDVERFKDSTRVTVYRIKKDVVDSKMYERTFINNETRELNLFGLDGRDSLVVRGRSTNGIKIRLVGGTDEDQFIDEGRGGKTLVYDNSSKKNPIKKGPGTRLKLTNDDWTNQYDPNTFTYDRSGKSLSGDLNGDDGLFIGLGFNKRHYGFQKEPYSYDLKAGGMYAPKTGAFTINAESNIYSLFKRNSDLVLSVNYNNPRNLFSYYGQGNSTLNPDDNRDYFRMRSRNFSANAYFQHRYTKAFKMGIGPGYESINVSEIPGRFVTSAAFPDKGDVGGTSHFGTLKSYADIDYVDNQVFPTQGVRLRAEANYFHNLRDNDNRFAQLKSEISFYATPNFNFPVTYAIRIGGATHIGDYKFFHANTLGRNTYLRGFMNNRFSGRSYLFQNSELRVKVTTFRNYIFTGNFGVFGFYDAGRVYSDVPESGKWHSGYGPGLWVNVFNKFMVSGAYGFSNEGKYISVKTGLSF